MRSAFFSCRFMFSSCRFIFSSLGLTFSSCGLNLHQKLVIILSIIAMVLPSALCTNYRYKILNGEKNYKHIPIGGSTHVHTCGIYHIDRACSCGSRNNWDGNRSPDLPTSFLVICVLQSNIEIKEPKYLRRLKVQLYIERNLTPNI